AIPRGCFFRSPMPKLSSFSGFSQWQPQASRPSGSGVSLLKPSELTCSSVSISQGDFLKRSRFSIGSATFGAPGMLDDCGDESLECVELGVHAELPTGVPDSSEQPANSDKPTKAAMIPGRTFIDCFPDSGRRSRRTGIFILWRSLSLPQLLAELLESPVQAAFIFPASSLKTSVRSLNRPVSSVDLELAAW